MNENLMKLIKPKRKYCAIKYDIVSHWCQNMYFFQAFNYGLFEQEIADESITMFCITA